MGGRDFVRREKKKPKKDTKKQSVISTTFDSSQSEVQVIRKGKKTKDFEEET